MQKNNCGGNKLFKITVDLNDINGKITLKSNGSLSNDTSIYMSLDNSSKRFIGLYPIKEREHTIEFDNLLPNTQYYFGYEVNGNYCDEFSNYKGSENPSD
jgi:hypothetical protein